MKYLPVLIAGVAVIGMLFGMRLQESLEYDKVVKISENQPEESINEAFEHIRTKYYGDIDYDRITDQILAGMIEELDPYSHYFSPERDDDYNRYVQGLYEGIGMEYTLYRDTCFITSVIADSPIEKSNIKRGDVILSIDDIQVTNNGISLDSVIAISKKEKGDSIRLSILNFRTKNITNHKIEVSNISLPLIKSFFFSDQEDVAYVQINRFYSGVFRDFMDVIDKFKKDSSESKHLIIDLRGNMGGVVDETVKIINQFIDEKNRPILSTTNKADKKKEYKSNGRIYYQLDRLCILVNEKSASASEILAAAIQDLDRGVIIGAPTFGKGVIQQNYNLTNNGSINLTIGEYVLPSGRRIGKEPLVDSIYYSSNGRMLSVGKGVQPDIRINSCLPYNSNPTNIDRDILSYKLWENEDLVAYVSEAQSQVSTIDSCEIFNIHSHYWETIGHTLPNGSVIQSDICDLTIRKAIEVVLGIEYDEILSN